MSPAARGGITVTELVATEGLGLRVLAGAGGLGRRITWTHVSELSRPEVWLDGGELLITNGLGLPGDPDGQRAFVAALDAKRLAGLALGVLGPQLDDAARALADELDFPILHVPRSTPFVSIARLIADCNQDHAHRRMATHLRLFDTLQSGLHADDASEFLGKLAGISGYRLYLTAPSGLPLLPGLEELPAPLAEHLDPSSQWQSHSFPGGYAVPLPLGNRTAGYLIALEQDGVDPAGLGAVRHIATMAALLVSDLYRERELERRRGAEVLGRIFAATDPTEAERLLAGTGLEERPLVIAKVHGSADAIDEIDHRLCDLGLRHLLLSSDREAYLVLPAADDHLTSAVCDLDAVVGLSMAFLPSAPWLLSRLEADRALDRAFAGGRPAGTVTRYSVADSPLEWLPSDPALLATFSHEVLDPLAAYDREHDTRLLESLRVYLECDRKLSAAADALLIHKHTLAYRLKRIEEIMGRRLTRMDDLCVIWMALKVATATGKEAGRAG
ncbi:MAG TPA: PucR family transcriptional regulator ligand-binding domain-containing protein [Capillimicrobium sp.]|nr:PucR family transcriptional regulator ligand-binding domain-containing protein [Capillimicrobium sp.]